jgi:hypothetical protein
MAHHGLADVGLLVDIAVGRGEGGSCCDDEDSRQTHVDGWVFLVCLTMQSLEQLCQERAKVRKEQVF